MLLGAGRRAGRRARGARALGPTLVRAPEGAPAWARNGVALESCLSRHRI